MDRVRQHSVTASAAFAAPPPARPPTFGITRPSSSRKARVRATSATATLCSALSARTPVVGGKSCSSAATAEELAEGEATLPERLRGPTCLEEGRSRLPLRLRREAGGKSTLPERLRGGLPPPAAFLGRLPLATTSFGCGALWRSSSLRSVRVRRSWRPAPLDTRDRKDFSRPSGLL